MKIITFAWFLFRIYMKKIQITYETFNDKLNRLLTILKLKIIVLHIEVGVV